MLTVKIGQSAKQTLPSCFYHRDGQKAYTWIISFRAWTKKTSFLGADPAETSMAGSHNQLGRFSKFIN
jgi:hypothetical protein